jgi:hypothetical protein
MIASNHVKNVTRSSLSRCRHDTRAHPINQEKCDGLSLEDYGNPKNHPLATPPACKKVVGGTRVDDQKRKEL